MKFYTRLSRIASFLVNSILNKKDRGETLDWNTISLFKGYDRMCYAKIADSFLSDMVLGSMVMNTYHWTFTSRLFEKEKGTVTLYSINIIGFSGNAWNLSYTKLIKTCCVIRLYSSVPLFNVVVYICKYRY
jgi:hypothetical protein